MSGQFYCVTYFIFLELLIYFEQIGGGGVVSTIVLQHDVCCAGNCIMIQKNLILFTMCNIVQIKFG